MGQNMMLMLNTVRSQGRDTTQNFSQRTKNASRQILQNMLGRGWAHWAEGDLLLEAAISNIQPQQENASRGHWIRTPK